MLPLTEKQRGVVKRLSSNPDFKEFLDILSSWLANQDKVNRGTVDDVSLRRGQGFAICLQCILDVATSPTN